MINAHNVAPRSRKACFPLAMAGEPYLNGPSPSRASNSQNPPFIPTPSSTYIPHFRFRRPPVVLSQAHNHSLTAHEYSPFDLPSSSLVSSSIIGEEPLDSEEEERHSEEIPQEKELGLAEGGVYEQGNRRLKSGRLKRHQPHMHAEVAVHAHENPGVSVSRVGQALESPRAAVGNGSLEASVDKASSNEGTQSSSDRPSGGDSESTDQHSDGSSGEKDMISHLALHDDERGRVSPLRALSHIAHIKRKQDCLQNDVEQLRCGDSNEFFVKIVQESSLKGRKSKQVQFQLEPVAYQKLMKILNEQHQGSFERFIMATLESIPMEDKPIKRTAALPRKPAFSKWKRTRFDQLKGNETEELALAFRSLAESTPNVEITSDMIHIPWQELNMLQVQKMLEETKKMLLINEKVHDCPFADCGRRFSTPGNLKDHLNEHSGERPYSCTFEDCPHRFRSKQHLCRHLKKHERAHTCTFEGCNKRFAFRERLMVHQKIHSDDRPLSCPWEGCGKTFKWANSLHGHMRTHTGEKPFQCTFAGCGRLFGYKVDLTRHRRTHFGQPARASH